MFRLPPFMTAAHYSTRRFWAAGTFLPQPGESVRVSGNWGNFEGSNAVAFSGAMALGTQTFLTAGVGVGLEEDTVGGRAGVSFGW